MLYGLSLLYGMTGALRLRRHPRRRCWPAGSNAFGLLVVVVLVLAGISYKIAAVPFHFWCPDVYEGAPTPVSRALLGGPQGGRLRPDDPLLLHHPGRGPGRGRLRPRWCSSINWPLLVAVISAVTMTYGNLVALRQDNVKRLLAYSSIAHVGYLLMGFVLLTRRRPGGHPVLPAGLHPDEPGRLPLRGGDQQPPQERGPGRLRGPGLPRALGRRDDGRLPGLADRACRRSPGFVGKFYLFTAVMDKQWFWLAIIARAEQRGQPLLLLPGREGDVPDAARPRAPTPRR